MENQTIKIRIVETTNGDANKAGKYQKKVLTLVNSFTLIDDGRRNFERVPVDADFKGAVWFDATDNKGKQYIVSDSKGDLLRLSKGIHTFSLGFRLDDSFRQNYSNIIEVL